MIGGVVRDRERSNGVRYGLHVPLGDWSKHLHRIATRHMRQFVVADIALAQGDGEIIEVADHGGRCVDVQLSAGHGTNAEAMWHAAWNEDERTRGTTVVTSVEKDDV